MIPVTSLRAVINSNSKCRETDVRGPIEARGAWIRRDFVSENAAEERGLGDKAIGRRIARGDLRRPEVHDPAVGHPVVGHPVIGHPVDGHPVVGCWGRLSRESGFGAISSAKMRPRRQERRGAS